MKFHRLLGINLAVTLLLVTIYICVHETVHIGQLLLNGDIPSLTFFTAGAIALITPNNLNYNPEPLARIIGIAYITLTLSSISKNYYIFTKPKGATT